MSAHEARPAAVAGEEFPAKTMVARARSNEIKLLTRRFNEIVSHDKPPPPDLRRY